MSAKTQTISCKMIMVVNNISFFVFLLQLLQLESKRALNTDSFKLKNCKSLSFSSLKIKCYIEVFGQCLTILKYVKTEIWFGFQ